MSLGCHLEEHKTCRFASGNTSQYFHAFSFLVCTLNVPPPHTALLIRSFLLSVKVINCSSTIFPFLATGRICSLFLKTLLTGRHFTVTSVTFSSAEVLGLSVGLKDAPIRLQHYESQQITNIQTSSRNKVRFCLNSTKG